MSRFAGKTVLITAGAAGIGEGIVRRFADEGANLAVCDVDEVALEATLKDLRPTGGRNYSRIVDVTDGVALEAFVNDAAVHFGRLDVVVNNAGGGGVGNVDQLSYDSWRKTVALTLDSVYHTCHAGVPHLKATRGCVVNIASVAGLFGEYDVPAYSAAKAGVINLTRTLAWNHGPDGLRVNSVSPGPTASRSMKWMWGDPTLRRKFDDIVPLRRWGEPADIAAAIAFLASDDASFITGVNIVVDGGMTLGTGSPRLTEVAAGALDDGN